jgi:hypothetical protein
MRKSHVGMVASFPLVPLVERPDGFKEFVPEKAAHRRMFSPPYFKGYVHHVGPAIFLMGIEVSIVDASTPSLALG